MAIFLAIGVGAYLATLVGTIPVAIAVRQPPGIASLRGTLWRGDATLIDGETLEWRWAPLRSLISLGFAVDWTVAGAGTDLGGRALLRPGALAVDDMSGGAGGSLLAAALPGLAFVCDMPLQIAMGRLRIGGGAAAMTGDIRSGAGVCAPKAGGATTLVPPMIAHFAEVGGKSVISLAPTAQWRRRFVDGTLDQSGRLRLTVTRDGAAALPFLSPSGGMAIDTAL